PVVINYRVSSCRAPRSEPGVDSKYSVGKEGRGDLVIHGGVDEPVDNDVLAVGVAVVRQDVDIGDISDSNDDRIVFSDGGEYLRWCVDGQHRHLTRRTELAVGYGVLHRHRLTDPGNVRDAQHSVLKDRDPN